MRERRASLTAEWVATARSLARGLPEEARLADDPFGAAFAGTFTSRLVRAITRHPRVSRPFLMAPTPVLSFVAYMQVRTRVLDDALLSFLKNGGTQVVILGAGFDARAARFADALQSARVWEIDHPATQAHKRDVLAAAHSREGRVTYVPWNFETDAMDAMGARLSEEGFDRTRPTLTIWEGVTMYLSEAAIDASVRSVASWSAPGSLLAVTYFDRDLMSRPSIMRRALHGVAALVGEPFRFGWSPDALAAWFAERGFRLQRDRSIFDHGAELLPVPYARSLGDRVSRVAIVERIALLEKP